MRVRIKSRDNDVIEQCIRMTAHQDLDASVLSARAVIKGNSFDVFVAETPAQKTAGLEVVNLLEENEGMYFPFDPKQHVQFHMGAVRFPIDILFLMGGPTNLHIAKIVHNVQPDSSDTWSNPDTNSVLEISGGLCKRLGIKIGDPVDVMLRVSLNK